MIECDHTTEPIVAWRVWKVRDGRLQSLVYSSMWPVREMMVAKCSRNQMMVTGSADMGPLPRKNCVCGIHAVKTLDLALKQCGNATWTFPGRPQLVVGRVSLWGHIIEHERGYRAQFAYPLDLMIRGGSCQPLCRLYAVDELPQPVEA